MAKKLTKAKAREILHDKEVHGHPLTDKQRRFFGAVSSGYIKAQNGIEGTMGGLTDKGFNFNPAWGGAWKNGGWLEKYAHGGILQPPMAGANQTVPMAQTGTRQPIYTSDPRDPRLRAYQDSLSLSRSNFYVPYGEKLFNSKDDLKSFFKYDIGDYGFVRDDEFVETSRYQKGIQPVDYADWEHNRKLFTTMPHTRILYKKPVQPIEYRKRVLEKPGGVDLPEEIQFKDLPQPREGYRSATPQPQMISETPTKYSYTYPSGNEQKTIYFPGKSAWQAFVDQYDGLSTEERAGSFSASPGVYSQMRRPNPVFGNLKFAMGGSLPGSVGFTYARVAGAAPSEGPRAKKTLPSAQNGMEMKFYQEGLDFKPKTISKNGGWLDKYETPEAQKGQVLQQRYSTGPMMGDLPAPSQAEVARQAQIRKESEALKQQQEARARYEAMPKIGPARERNYSEQVQANEQRRRLNQAYAAENPEVTIDDSGDIVPSGYGRFIQTYGPNLDKFARSLETPLAIEAAVSLAPLVGRGLATGARATGEYLTTQTPLRNAYKLNPWAFKVNPEAYYRGVGKEGIEDIFESGVIRSKKQNAYPEPYFSKGVIGDKYAKGYFAELTNEPMKGVGNFSTGDLIQTPVNTISINNANLKLYQKDWLRGYKEVPKSISEALPPPQQNNFGSIYTLNPITALGDLGDYKYYRKIGSGSGIKDLIESGAIRSGGGYDAPYFSPNTTWEGYRGTFAVGVNPRQVEGLEMINKNRGGLQRGFKSSLDEIPLSEGATGVFRRLPFSSAYTEIPVSSVLDPSKRTLREKILLNPTLANIQHGSEEALRYGIKGSVAQYIGNELYGTEKDPTPLGTPVLLPVVSSLKKKFEKSFSNQPQQKEDGGEIVKDDEGYWNPQNWGKPVEINSNEITMEGVLEPLLGISDTGDRQMMYPGKNYTFEGTKVVEYPREYFTARDGKSVNRADEYPLEKLDNLLNFTNYNKPTAKNGKWLDKYK